MSTHLNPRVIKAYITAMKVAAKPPPPLPLRTKIADHLWIGNVSASDDRNFMEFAQISARVTLDKLDNEDSETDFMPFPGDALLDAEIPAALARADEIVKFITLLIKNGHDVLLQCENGMAKSPCIAARYLSKLMSPQVAIARMRVCYMSAAQAQAQAQEDQHIAHATKYQPDKLPELDTTEAAQKRRALLTLTNLSQQKLLK
jgi:hypothetical protein